MATFTTYRLHFTTPVHIGDNREDYGSSLLSIQSDTLQAALTACLAKTGTTIPQNGDLGFTCSSLFPYYQKDRESKPIYFFPKPLNQKLPKLKDLSKAKQVKKVQWIDAAFFEKILFGQSPIQSETDCDYIQSTYLSKESIPTDFIQRQISPRVSVSRTGMEDATPFYMERLFFTDYSGLFFLAVGDTRLLDQGIGILSQEGIGTDRNVGNGYFEFEKAAIELDIPQNGSHALNLSMFIPDNKNQLEQLLSGKNVAYDFSRRGGWITDTAYTGIRKNFIHAFLPGSVFAKEMQQAECSGRIVNLAPDLSEINMQPIPHPIWRSGRALFLPINI